MSTPTDNAMATHDMRPLEQRLERAEARVWQRNVLSLSAFILGCLMLSFAGYFVLDYVTHFPAAVRVLMTLGLLGAFLYWLPRRYRPLWTKETDINRMARKIEQEVAARKPGGFGSLLVSGLEFGTRPTIGGSAVLKDRTVEHSLGGECDPLSVDLHDAPMQARGLKTLGAAIVVYVIWALVGGATLLVFAQRLAGLPAEYPTRTQIVELRYPEISKAADDVLIEVQAGGELPGGGTVRVAYVGESAFDITLTPTEDDPSLYQATVPRAVKPFEFRVRLGDADRRDLQVRVVQSPTVTDGQITVTAPAYTRIKPRDYRLSNISVPAGSSLSLQIQPDREVEVCELVTTTGSHPLTKGADGSYSLQALPVPEPVGFSIRMVDGLGIENTDRITYRVGVIADREPAVRMARPESESYWAPVSKVRWETRVSDDYGLREMRLLMRIAEPTEEGGDNVVATTHKAIAMQPGHTELEEQGELPISETGAKPGQILLLSVQVRDVGPADEPDDESTWHNSETLRLHVVTAAELREIILAEEQLAYKQIGDVADDVKHQIRMMQMQEQLKEGSE